MKNFKSKILLWIFLFLAIIFFILMSQEPSRTDAYIGVATTINQQYEI